MTFLQILKKLRKEARDPKDLGTRFEKLIRGFFLTYPMYSEDIATVWPWGKFPFRDQISKRDTGIDLVAKAKNGEYWAIQCKCYAEDYVFKQDEADSFISLSAMKFRDENGKRVGFAKRFWVSSTYNFGPNFELKLKNQDPPVAKITLGFLQDTNVKWEEIEKGLYGGKSLEGPKKLRKHQQDAIYGAPKPYVKSEGKDKNRKRKEARYPGSREYFKTFDRGKLIMACGTGKTLTALRIAEDLLSYNLKKKDGGLVLCLVPSIALVKQMLKAWMEDAIKPIHAICVCSDRTVSNLDSDDNAYGKIEDLPYPASTDPEDVANQIRYYLKRPSGHTVVFSTYHSIKVVSDAQKLLKSKGVFDLIICDEAHRTTGVALEKGDESAFMKVHDNEFLRAKKRLYMTATPRIYKPNSKQKKDVVICSMGDKKLYGDDIYKLGFSSAVEKELLSDYKVLVLMLSETEVEENLRKALEDKILRKLLGDELVGTIEKALESKNKSKEKGASGSKKKSEIGALQKIFDNSNNPMVDVGKLIGCINALSKKRLVNGELISASDPEPMHRAVAFCQTIKNSRLTAEILETIQEVYFKSQNNADDQNSLVRLETRHVDGTMAASKREECLNWLQEGPERNTCRVLTNVRCLSEGVDVPALDAVLFLSPKGSEIDIVQCVGRVMRKAEGKKYGYVILPVIVPDSDANSTSDYLKNDDRFGTVWSVLTSLRALDDRFDVEVHKLALTKGKDVFPGPVTVVTTDNSQKNDGSEGGGDAAIESKKAQDRFNCIFASLTGDFYVKMVEKVGERFYWENWAKRVGKIAGRHEGWIEKVVATGGKHKKAFDEFLGELRRNLNPDIGKKDAIEMLAQHIVSKPVFDALFADNAFTENNVISRALSKILDLLEDENQEEDSETLEYFYESVQKRVERIDSLEARQEIIKELYEKFFKTAYSDTVKKLGIVYTPIEIVDFLIHSVESVLNEEFGSSLADKNVHILDPFTGTGTFITRLLQSGIIPKKKLLQKYKNEIHANEIVLLAYYIACVNIESVFAEISGSKTYESFPGACLTDTFQLGEYGTKGAAQMLSDNTGRVVAQKEAQIRVIIGNPPYSAKQEDESDNAQNQHYKILEEDIANTYAKRSTAQNKNALYDSYFKAFRWASNRIDPKNGGKGGVIAFVTNAGWIDGNSQDGFRKCIEEEFSKIYVFNLRGNLNIPEEIAREKECACVFPITTPVALSILVKNKKPVGTKAQIFYRDIGDYLSREEKLKIISAAHDINFRDGKKWKCLKPNEYGDWINLRNKKFHDLTLLSPLSGKYDPFSESIFVVSSSGLKTGRDSRAYDFSRRRLSQRMKEEIGFYNDKVKIFVDAKAKNPNVKIGDVVDLKSKSFKWGDDQKKSLKKGEFHDPSSDFIMVATYRLFQKRYLYYSRGFNSRVYKIPNLFPNPNCENLVICTQGMGGETGFSCFITNVIPDINSQVAGAQCFPLYYYYEKNLEKKQDELFNLMDEQDDDVVVDKKKGLVRRSGISRFAWDKARELYGGDVSKEDIFYYVYGILHAPDLVKKFAANFKKEPPRVPLVATSKDFWAFSKAGRKLAYLHLNYEKLPIPKNIDVRHSSDKLNYHLSKMLYKKGLKVKDRPEEIFYNDEITIGSIPKEAYEYVVAGAPALRWVMTGYAVATDTKTGITTDPNLWCDEQKDSQYIVNLLLRVIYLSCETVKIVKSLPKIDFSEV